MAMKIPVTLVVLGKYDSIFRPFYNSAKKLNPNVTKVLVRDGNDIFPPLGYTTVDGKEPFSMAGNANIGWQQVPETNDILYCGDDIRFLSQNVVENLQEIAYSSNDIGIVSPKIFGRGSPFQVNALGDFVDTPPIHLWFPCVYIKREVIKKIGFLDEQFDGCVGDDTDYCIRAVQAGFRIGVTEKVMVVHEGDASSGPTTFTKELGEDRLKADRLAYIEKLRVKYDVPVEKFNQFLMTGKLESDEVTDSENLPDTATPEQATAYIKKRSLYIATPAYGGMMSVNYTQSLLGLIDLCHNVGVRYKVSFKYNESLIPRARNSMVDDFMTQSDFTDFVFIDADIGFDPREVLMLMIRPEEVIGAPCVRKSFNWHRVSEVIKKNGQALTGDQLSVLAGEFVLNFMPGQVPKSINLGQPLEVLDVGTGLMRIKREVFLKLQKKSPENWYMPMNGEGNSHPHFMYFQSRIDYDSAQYTGNGIPNYIPEDYSFCRDCRKAGIKVWVAPWIKTSHLGSYIYQGDVVALAQAGGAL